jgi:hypothetical protein
MATMGTTTWAVTMTAAAGTNISRRWFWRDFLLLREVLASSLKQPIVSSRIGQDSENLHSRRL